jgi:superoxide dismutase, Fe-Mn family
MTRRELIGTIIRGSLIASLTDVSSIFEGGMVMAQESEKKSASSSQLGPAYKGENQIKPLPFNPAKLLGSSEKLLVSHHQNNYGGAVRRLNQIQQQIGGLAKDAQPYQMGSLKREEIVATNSMILHESYFGNLGGDGKAGRHHRKFDQRPSWFAR